MNSEFVNNMVSMPADAIEEVSNHNEDQEPSYLDHFPPLPEGSAGPVPTPNIGKTFRSSRVTQVFCVPVEERRTLDVSGQSRFGDQEPQARACQETINKHGLDVTIEMSCAKDQSLTVMITGKNEAVLAAKKLIIQHLQTLTKVYVKVPAEHHGAILGPRHTKIHALEAATSTTILVPERFNGDTITITGSKEGCDKARHEIETASQELAKRGLEKLSIPKVYHPFICGPFNERVRELMNLTGCKISVPPPVVDNDEIVISGEKDPVRQCAQTIMEVYNTQKRVCQTVSVEVRKSQHKFIIGKGGSNLQEILRETGVSVEVPSTANPSDTITLRGPQDKLGPALTLVYSKANSVVVVEVDAPFWLHRYVIGPRGDNVREITQYLSKVHIEFTEGKNKITIEGPPEEVEQAQRALEARVKQLKSTLDYAEINIPQKFHRHIIGKNGQNVAKIKQETGANIRVLSGTDKTDTIRIEGTKDEIKNAKNQLLEMSKKMENEKSRDIIIENRFHKLLIGQYGNEIAKIRDMFNQVQVTFPGKDKSSDVVQLRGARNDVDKCFAYLTKRQQDLIAQNYKDTVHIYKEFHKNIIGKKGAMLSKIRDETDTRIDLPAAGSDSDVITIMGLKKNVEDAKKKIESIQKDLINIKECTVDIPHKYHTSMIGANGHLIKNIMNECGGVLIRFPASGSGSDKVIIRGPQEDLDRARTYLLDLSYKRIENDFTAEVHAKPEFHKFLIGRKGSNIHKIWEETETRIIIPPTNSEDPHRITLVGKKEGVLKAKSRIEELVRGLENIIEDEVSVEPKYHRHFVARRGEVLSKIQNENGDVVISFPRIGVDSDRVTLKGARECVEGAKACILDIVAELDSQVTIECVIPQVHHGTIMGAKGKNVQEITNYHQVQIKFPDRAPRRFYQGDQQMNDGEQAVNGYSENGKADKSKNDVITITGLTDNCEAAKNALLRLVPVTEEIPVPYQYHGFIIGVKGADVRRLMQEHEVSISIPAQNAQSDLIKVTGSPDNVEAVRSVLAERVKQFEAEDEDRKLKSFTLEMRVDPLYHPKIIGTRGTIISKLRDDFDVQIQFPERSAPSDASDLIKIRGYEANTERAREAIKKIVEELESRVTHSVSVDPRVHPRLIGTKGKTIRKMMDEFRVDIKLPTTNGDEGDIVKVTGAEEDVFDCIDHIQQIADDYLQDILDREFMNSCSRPPSMQASGEDGQASRTHSKGYVMRDAPWSKPAPDSNNVDEFPGLGAANSGGPSPVIWGPRSK